MKNLRSDHYCTFSYTKMSRNAVFGEEITIKSLVIHSISLKQARKIPHF